MNRIQATMAAVLGTFADFPNGCPASTVYMATGTDFTFWEQINRIGQGAGLWTCNAAHWLTPTPKGIELGKQINAATASLSAETAGGAA
jgi:hypothetical protein